MGRSLLILGAGGHGRVVREVALALKDALGQPVYEKVDFLDDNASDAAGCMDDLESMSGCYDDVFCGVGNNIVRKSLQERAVAVGFNVPTLVHPTAYVSPSASLGIGVLVEPKAVINAGVDVGKGSILSAGSIVDHDSSIGEFCHINTGAICMAGSCVGAGRKIGTGEVVTGFTKR